MITKLMGNKKGFTIIELIVVIAIIAVLAGIVLVNVTGYINKGKDSAIKGNLSSLMTDAAVVMDTYSSFNNSAANSVCGAGGPWTAIGAAINAAGGTSATCLNNTTNWCASSVMKNNGSNSFCVDSSGKKGEGITASYTCAANACP
jgi:prepilin-type N-terminal cleavage/methylation domain-containing protein